MWKNLLIYFNLLLLMNINPVICSGKPMKGLPFLISGLAIIPPGTYMVIDGLRDGSEDAVFKGGLLLSASFFLIPFGISKHIKRKKWEEGRELTLLKINSVISYNEKHIKIGIIGVF